MKSFLFFRRTPLFLALASAFLCHPAWSQSYSGEVSGPIRGHDIGMVNAVLEGYVSTTKDRNEKGAVEVTAGGTLAVSGSTFSNNENGTSSVNGELVKPGAGVFYLNTGTQGEISQSSFTGNRDYYFNKEAGDKSAGAVFNDGVLAITNTSFAGNSDNFAGGAVNNYVNGTLAIAGSRFEGNGKVADLDTRFGGAITNYGQLTDTGSVYVGNTVVTQGGALQQAVGAVGSGFAPSMSLANDVFQENSSGGHGGAIAVQHGSFRDFGSRYTGNRAAYSGGAFRIYAGATGMTNGDVFEGNTATNTGGGAVYNAGTLTDSASVYSRNTGRQGGAVYNAGKMSVSGGEFRGNEAFTNGGAIRNAKTLQVTDGVFAGNTAGDAGGAMYNGDAGTVLMGGKNLFEGNAANGKDNDIHNDGVFSFGSEDVEHVATVLNGGVTGTGTMSLNEGTLTLAQDRQIHQNAFRAAAGTTTYVTLGASHLVQENGVKYFHELDDGVRDGHDKALETIGKEGFSIHTRGDMQLDKDAVLHITLNDNEPGKTYLVAYNERSAENAGDTAASLVTQGFSHEDTAWKGGNLQSANPMLEFDRVGEDNTNGYVMVSSRESNSVGIIEDMGGVSHIYYGWLSDLSDLRHRLGEVRYGAQDGVWGKVIYSRYHARGLGDGEVKAEDYSVHIGIDRLIDKGEDHSWLVGMSFKGGHADTESYRYDGSGNMDHYMLKAYGTYMDKSGGYADIVGTVGYFDTDFSGFHNERTGYMRGDFSNWGYGFSVEAGHMFSWGEEVDDRQWHNHWFFEPQIQLSWFHVDGQNYDTSNAIHVRQNDVDFLTGRLGGVLGKKFSYGGENSLDKRYVQIAGRAGLIHEFDGDQSLYMNGRRFTGHVAENVFYYGLDLDWQFGIDQKLYLQVDRAHGDGYHKDIQVRAGYRYRF